MLERDGYLPGVPCWVDTSQPDPEAAVAFYSGVFGWDFRDAMPPGSAGKYFIARHPDAAADGRMEHVRLG
jgi:predicted enzyme related to lactoylglutathione lyase